MIPFEKIIAIDIPLFEKVRGCSFVIFFNLKGRKSFEQITMENGKEGFVRVYFHKLY